MLPDKLQSLISKEGITEFRPCQKKALDANLLNNQSLLICTPTASGKTLVAEMAAINKILNNDGKTIYLVPLIALANEKYKDFKRKYSSIAKIALSIGDMDNAEPNLIDYDIIICTAEKLDSLIRHRATWLSMVSLIVIDEIHLLNDVSRGPTLEILITMLKTLTPAAQIIGLSATIGNPQELADWLKAKLIIDNWRPVPLKKAVYVSGKINFELQTNTSQ